MLDVYLKNVVALKVMYEIQNRNVTDGDGLKKEKGDIIGSYRINC
jgi:hypothetical protein